MFFVASVCAQPVTIQCHPSNSSCLCHCSLYPACHNPVPSILSLSVLLFSAIQTQAVLVIAASTQPVTIQCHPSNSSCVCHCRTAPFQSARQGLCTPGSSVSACPYGSSSVLSATRIASGGASVPITCTQGATQNWTQNLTLPQTCDGLKTAGC